MQRASSKSCSAFFAYNALRHTRANLAVILQGSRKNDAYIIVAIHYLQPLNIYTCAARAGRLVITLVICLFHSISYHLHVANILLR
jgi:hypothetical protein